MVLIFHRLIVTSFSEAGKCILPYFFQGFSRSRGRIYPHKVTKSLPGCGREMMKRQAVRQQAVLQLADRLFRHGAALYVKSLIEALRMSRHVGDHATPIYPLAIDLHLGDD